MQLSAPRSISWKSSRSLWRAVPLLGVALFFAFQASIDHDAASKQHTSFGTITDCQQSGRGGNSCHYVYQVDGEVYTGRDGADASLQFGNTVTVYYNSQNPTMSSLKDFSGRSREEWIFVCFGLLAIVAVVAFGSSSKATSREDSKQPTT
jgi:hypothetical protein